MSDDASPITSTDPDEARRSDSLASPLAQRVKDECEAMIRCVLKKGLKLPTDLFPLLAIMDDSRRLPDLGEMVKLHNRLAEIISPATPGAVYLLDSDPTKHSVLRFFGPVPNIRYLMVASIVFISGFVGLSMTSYVNHQTLSKDIYDLVGCELLTIMLFLLSASGLGACFSALFSAYRFIADSTYDPRYDSSYWSQIILGLIAGLVISQLIPVQDWVNGSADTAGVSPAENSSFSRPLLALLGGFSASMVYKVLQRLVEAVESLFQGDATQSAAQQEQAIRAKLERQFGERRLSAATDLIALKEAVAHHAPSERIAALAAKALNNLTLSANVAALSAELPTDLNRDRPNNERPIAAENRDGG